jgi:glycosyltransferase involved in cell wall biosynthesis
MTHVDRPRERGAVRDRPDADRIADEAVRSFMSAHATRADADLVVVIPALNEAGSIKAVIEEIPREVLGLTVESLVIDDGSSDATADLAVSCGALVCSLGRNLGQGRALRVGYLLARSRGARYVVTLDADGQFDPAELADVVAPLVEGRADFVNGTRRLGSDMTSDPVRALGLTVFARIVSAVTGVRISDPANGFRALRTEVVATVPLRQSQYQTPELLIGAIKCGFRVTEVPVTVRDRSAGTSKKGRNLVYGARFARTILETWLRFTFARAARVPEGSPG